MIKYIKFPFFIFFAVFIYFFYFHSLGFENINEDQYRWYLRSEKFFTAFGSGDYKNTYQQYHPGVSLMYLIKAGVEVFKYTNTLNFSTFKEIPYHLFPTFNFYTKLILVIFTLISIFLLTYLINNLYGKFIAISFLVFLTFDTYFIGLTRNLHMDSFLAVCISISIISFYLFLKTSEKKYLVISSIYSGFGLLTKSVFAIGILFQFLIASFYAINGKISFRPIKLFFYNLLISFVIFSAFFPSMWVSPLETLSNIYIRGAYSTGLGGDDNFMHYVNGFELPNPGYKFYIHVLNYRLSPMIYFTILFIVVFNIIKVLKNKKFHLQIDSLIFINILFVIFYLVIITYSSKKTDRYLSIIFPSLALITAYYLRITWIRINNNLLKICISGFTFVTILINLTIHPYYFAFYNPFFGGISEAQKRIYINQGGIAFLEVIKELEKFPNFKFSAVNYEELSYSNKSKIAPLNYFNQAEPRYIKVLPLQRGDNLIKNSIFIKNIEIMKEPFWRIYQQN